MARTEHVIAVDVGGTDTKAALVAGTPGGVRAVERRRRPTARHEDGDATAEAVVEQVAALADELRAATGREAAALGVVVPGIVDEAGGTGVYSANLGWRDYPFARRLAERTGLPTAFGHDVRAGGLAELRAGAARGLRSAVIMPIGTGIAAALVHDGRVLDAPGEIGHVDVGHGEPCGCGQRGCVEARASSAAIARRYAARAGHEVRGAAEVAALVRAGDPDALTVWHEAVDALARGILQVAALLGPEAVVLGGGLAMAGPLLTDPLRTRLDELITFQRRPELRLAALGDEAGCLGAALLAIDTLEER
ncbi:ROK family protein [Saccharothrix coeruleofusca]|uniref:Glucokinase n=1 Tax=Saccharothrix coeruleofusca TaxID=33919 RepID=A0A918AVC7_9PSEU|nr:ROK family protein [Saccharothrix coeruleofusca]GGP80420.1 glucokinase [Saccharothrix coeruleofusca]